MGHSTSKFRWILRRFSSVIRESCLWFFFAIDFFSISKLIKCPKQNETSVEVFTFLSAGKSGCLAMRITPSLRRNLLRYAILGHRKSIYVSEYTDQSFMLRTIEVLIRCLVKPVKKTKVSHRQQLPELVELRNIIAPLGRWGRCSR